MPRGRDLRKIFIQGRPPPALVKKFCDKFWRVICMHFVVASFLVLSVSYVIILWCIWLDFNFVIYVGYQQITYMRYQRFIGVCRRNCDQQRRCDILRRRCEHQNYRQCGNHSHGDRLAGSSQVLPAAAVLHRDYCQRCMPAFSLQLTHGYMITCTTLSTEWNEEPKLPRTRRYIKASNGHEIWKGPPLQQTAWCLGEPGPQTLFGTFWVSLVNRKIHFAPVLTTLTAPICFDVLKISEVNILAGLIP